MWVSNGCFLYSFDCDYCVLVIITGAQPSWTLSVLIRSLHMVCEVEFIAIETLQVSKTYKNSAGHCGTDRKMFCLRRWWMIRQIPSDTQILSIACNQKKTFLIICTFMIFLSDLIFLENWWFSCVAKLVIFWKSEKITLETVRERDEIQWKILFFKGFGIRKVC